MSAIKLLIELESFRTLYDGDEFQEFSLDSEQKPKPFGEQSFEPDLEASEMYKTSNVNNFLVSEITFSGYADSSVATPLFCKPGRIYEPMQRLFTFKRLQKTSIESEALLNLSVLDIDNKSKAGRFLRRVFSAAIGTALAGPIGGISGVLAAATANDLKDSFVTEIKGEQTDSAKTAIMQALPIVLTVTSSNDLELQSYSPDEGILTPLQTNDGGHYIIPLLANFEISKMVKTKLAGRRGRDAIQKSPVRVFAKNDQIAQVSIKVSFS